MFALSPGYSILRGIMHSLSLSAILEKKKSIHTGRKKNITSFLSPQHSLWISSAQILPLPLRVYLFPFTLNIRNTTSSTGFLCHAGGGELQYVVEGTTHKERTVLGTWTG